MIKKFKVTQINGIHAKPATILVSEAYKYNSKILLGLNENFVNMKSIIGVMSLGIYNEATILIDITGSDEVDAMKNITKLLTENKWAKEL